MKWLTRSFRLINKMRWPLLVLLLLAGWGFYPRETQKEDYRKEQVVMNLMYQVLNSSHFAPQKINNDFSQRVFDRYMEELDIGHRFFTQADVEALSRYRDRLDQQYKSTSFNFYQAARKRFEKRHAQVQRYYRAILEAPFDFSREEYYDTDEDAKAPAADTNALRDRWRRYLKYRTLVRLEEYLEARENKADTVEKSSRKELEEKAREKVLETHNQWFENLGEMSQIDWVTGYLNAFATEYDPHTRYFPPRQQEDFEINMTGQLEGIGAQLQEKGDYIKITKIITGSACWRQGDLEVGDKILRVAQGDAPEEPVDLVGMSVRDAVQYIRGPKGTKVILTVRKVDGTKTNIPIVRDVVELESTFAKSAIVGEADQKIGYIRLPKFYVSFYSDHNRDVSDDVKAELEKLKEAGVKGVILDLRNNGGGALNEVVEIVGHFIDEGPVVQVKPSGQKPKILKDEESGKIYDGPLAVMTNRFSASASEIFAAAIQDYNRGLIVGSPSTFGKGTVQNVLEMDRAVGNAYKDLKPLGALKLTIQKFYRINGGTTQKRGVVPDIILPDTYGDMPMGESNRETALPYDEIEALDYQQWSSAPPITRLKRKSNKRVQKSEKFTALSQYAEWGKTRRERTEAPLTMAAYRAQQEKERETAEQYKGMRKSDTTLTITANAADLEDINATEESQKKAEQWHKNISDDVYLHETYEVLRDWVAMDK